MWNCIAHKIIPSCIPCETLWHTESSFLYAMWNLIPHTESYHLVYYVKPYSTQSYHLAYYVEPMYICTVLQLVGLPLEFTYYTSTFLINKYEIYHEIKKCSGQNYYTICTTHTYIWAIIQHYHQIHCPTSMENKDSSLPLFFRRVSQLVCWYLAFFISFSITIAVYLYQQWWVKELAGVILSQ